MDNMDLIISYIRTKKKLEKELEKIKADKNKIIKDDLHWLAMADLTAKKSKCQKRQIGAVIVTEDGRCVSCAYNFHPRNTDLDHECLRKDIPTGTRMDIGYCCHAEINAIIFTDWHDLQGATIYLTQAPCPACAPYLIQAGLSKIVYYKDEVKRPNGIEIIKALTSNHLEIRAYDRSVKE